tara:strand:+ start:490 stop:1680 length:1191 start_codon:yes stop_codon:yes gene_type:complete
MNGKQIIPHLNPKTHQDTYIDCGNADQLIKNIADIAMDIVKSMEILGVTSFEEFLTKGDKFVHMWAKKITTNNPELISASKITTNNPELISASKGGSDKLLSNYMPSGKISNNERYTMQLFCVLIGIWALSGFWYCTTGSVSAEVAAPIIDVVHNMNQAFVKGQDKGANMALTTGSTVFAGLEGLSGLNTHQLKEVVHTLVKASPACRNVLLPATVSETSFIKGSFIGMRKFNELHGDFKKFLSRVSGNTALCAAALMKNGGEYLNEQAKIEADEFKKNLGFVIAVYNFLIKMWYALYEDDYESLHKIFIDYSFEGFGAITTLIALIVGTGLTTQFLSGGSKNKTRKARKSKARKSKTRKSKARKAKSRKAKTRKSKARKSKTRKSKARKRTHKKR